MHRRLFIAALAAALIAPAFAPTASAGAKKGGPIRVVIIDGQNNHDWRSTTPFLEKALEDGGKFTVDVSTAPLAKNDKRGFAKAGRAVSAGQQKIKKALTGLKNAGYDLKS